MLEYLRVRYLQSHRDTTLEFSPGINCIVGDNNAGKTALVRALITLVLNPMGYMKKFKRLGQTKWPIIDIGWKGHEITRRKEGYILDGKEYKAVRDTVPTAIKQALNLTELNFKTIRDDLFFVAMSPGARARLLNKVTGIDMQEYFAGYCTKQVATIKTEIKAQEYLRTSLGREISILSPVLDLEPSIEQIGGLLDDLVTTETRFNTVANAYNSIIELDEVVDKKDDIEELRGLYEDAEEVMAERDKLEKERAYIESTVLELQQLENVLERREDVGRMAELIQKAEDALQKAENAGKAVDHLRAALDKVVQTQEMMDATKTELRNLQRRRKNLLQDLGICPLCESEIKKD